MSKMQHQGGRCARQNLLARSRQAMLLAFGAGLISSTAAVSAMAATASIEIAKQTIDRASSYTYFVHGLPDVQVVEPTGANGVKLSTSFTYSAAGNKESETHTGWNGEASEDRKSTTTWDDSKRFPSTRKNAALHTETLEYDPRFGGVTKRVDANGLMTRWEYDEFGRKSFERRGYADKDATTYTDYTSWTYERCVDIGGCSAVQNVTPSHVVTATTKYATGAQAQMKAAPTSKTYFDTLNREIRLATEALGDNNTAVKWVNRDTVYDTKGNVKKVSQPYFDSDSSIKWTEFEYDDLGRKTSETAPSGLLTEFEYIGWSTTSTSTVDGLVRKRTSKTNALGQLIEATDAKGNTTHYVYDAHGNLSHTVNPYGNVVKSDYDVRGRKIGLTDPDLGSWSYVVNAFGEVSSQTNGLNKTSKMVYDKLGRMTERKDGDLTTVFGYDTAANGKGLLASVSTDNGYCRSHTYDAMSRPSGSTLKVGAGSKACDNPSETLSAFMSHDVLGRVDTQTFPSGVKIKHGYHSSLGTLLAVNAYTGGAAGTAYWTRQAGDAAGRTTGFAYGNTVATVLSYDESQMGWLKRIAAGKDTATLADIQSSAYIYDSTGQISRRTDKFDMPEMPEMSERFRVDVLGRLESSARYSGESEKEGSRVTLDYDAIGRIKSKTDVGTYYYAGAASGQARPHAVTAVRGVLNADYDYDNGGQLTNGDGRSYLYTDSGHLRMAGKGLACQEFLMQGEGVRWQQAIYGAACKQKQTGEPDNSASPLLAKTLYMHPDATNGLSFERETKGGVVTYKHYISVGGRPVALLTGNNAKVVSDAGLTVSYLHYDHLGSIVVVTDANGTVKERRSFDTWGRARKTDGEPGSGELPGGLEAGSTDRGYTLHEHLEGLGLIHMNGRIYDPLLARFTSADPMVSSPYDLQSYDRYAYVMNRPLDASDPSGYSPVFSFSGGGGSSGNQYAGLTLSWNYGGGINSVGSNGQTAGGSGFRFSSSANPYSMFFYDNVNQAGGSQTFVRTDKAEKGEAGPRFDTVEGQVAGIQRAYATNGRLDGDTPSIESAASVLGMASGAGPLVGGTKLLAVGVMGLLKAGVKVEAGELAVLAGKGLAADVSWKGFTKGSLATHFDKHGAEFGKITQSEYLKHAKIFSAEAGTFLEQKVGNFIVKYDPATRRTLVGHAGSREIRTFYKADERSADPFNAAVELARQLGGR